MNTPKILAFIVGLGICTVVSAQTDTGKSRSLEERVSALEARVDALEGKTKVPPATLESRVDALGGQKQPTGSLEARIDALETKSKQPTFLTFAPTNQWKNPTLWRVKLDKGMSKDDVKSVFGEPDKVEADSTNGDLWYYGYPNGGTVQFDATGHVEGWRVPHVK
jgi:hypothetical protein